MDDKIKNEIQSATFEELSEVVGPSKSKKIKEYFK